MLVDLFLYLTFGISIAGELSDNIIFWFWFIGTFYIVFQIYQKKVGKNLWYPITDFSFNEPFSNGSPLFNHCGFCYQ